MSSIDFTGERFLPQVGGEIRQEHLHRYAFAAALVGGRIVLDAACGEGYGSDLLAAHAATVIGVDIDAPTIARARKTYAKRRNLRFERASVLELPLKTASVDVVVSFETLEHLAEQDIMLMEFRRVLRPDGLLLISTPDVTVYRGLSSEPNPFHVKELDAKELRALLKQQFRHLVVFGQRLATGSVIYPLPSARAAARAAEGGLLGHDEAGIKPGLPPLPESTYLIVAASNAALTEPPAGSMLLSAVDDLYAEYRRIAKWASGLDAEWRAAQESWRLEREGWNQARSGWTEQLEQARAEAAREAEARALAAHVRELDLLHEGHAGSLAERDVREAALVQAQAELEARLRDVQPLPAAELEALRTDLAAAQAERAAAQAELAETRDGLAAARAALAEVERDAAARRTQHAERIAGELLRHQHELRTHDEAAAARVAELEGRLQALAEQLRAQQAEAAATQQRLRDEAEAALAAARDAAAAAAAELAVARERNERLAGELKAQAAELRGELARALSARVAEHEALRRSEREQLEAAARERHAAELAALHERLREQAEAARGALQASQEAALAQAQAEASGRLAALDADWRERLQTVEANALLQLEAAQASAQQRLEAIEANARLRLEAAEASAQQRLETAETSAQQRLDGAEAVWRQRQARALLESRRRERSERDSQRQGHEARTRDLLERHRQNLRLAQEAQARLHDEHQARLAEWQARAEAQAAELARERAAWEARVAEQAEQLRRIEEAGSRQLEAAAKRHAEERAELQRRQAEAAEQAKQRDVEAADRLAQLAEVQRRTLAELSARHNGEMAAAHAHSQAQEEAASRRERAAAAKLFESQVRAQELQLDAARAVEAAREQARLALEAARQREQSLRDLLAQRSQLASLLGRELLAARGTLAWRLASPWRELRRHWAPLESLAAERRIHEMVVGAALINAAQAPDPRHAGTPGLPTLLPTDMNDSLPLIAMPSVEDLMELDDTAFIRAAYRAVLGRAPDEGGLRHYTQALLEGRTRLQVLADLHYSDEGKGRSVPLAGFEAAMRQLRLGRIPLLGRLLMRPSHAPSMYGVRRDLTALTGQVGRIDGTLHERMDNLERVLQVGVQGLAQHAMSAYSRIDARLASIEKALAAQVDVELRALSSQSADTDAPALAHALRNGLAAQSPTDFLAGDHRARMADVGDTLAAARREALALGEISAIVQSLGRFKWPPETDLWRLAERWVSAEAADFARDLFLVTLDREPHDYERTYFTERVISGSSRWMLVEKMLQSPEFTNRHVPEAGATPAAQPAPAATPTEAPLPELPMSAVPVVSVVVPVYGKVEYTLQCLRSIEANLPRVPFEVIVVDDASPDGSAETLARVRGIRLLRNPQNLGFIRSCNRGAGAARGAFLCLLNNDTEVMPGWLDELHATFELFPGTGFVGSKLLYPNGSLQEAGGILWRDGSAWNFGRGQDPSRPEFNYAREVDYCSGASIMLPTELFRRLGGLDEHYLPAYCEDSDIALKVRQAGLRVIYQPASCVIHHEGITSGTDTGSGVKAYQVANTKKLFERWQGLLAGYQDNGVDVDRAKDRMATRRVLVIDIVTPSPDQDAGSVTVVNFLTLLREMRFQVTFIPEDNFLYMPDYTVALQRAGVEALYAPAVTSVEQHLAAHGGRYDLVLMWRPTVVDLHLPAVRRHCPRAKVIYHTVDLHYLRMEREAELLQDAAKARAAAEMKRMELAAVQGVDSAIVHSTHEVDVLATQIPVDNVFVFPLIIDVPGSAVPFEARAGLAFVGGYQHVPNVDAVLYFVSEVMPLLRQRLPGVRFHVIGSKAPPQVLALAGDDVIVEGFVPELQPLLDRMRISVAPLRYGAGIKGKVGNSMAMGLPVVASSIAVEGMQLRHRHDVLIADGPQALADAICELYADKALWLQLQANALVTVDALSGAGASYANLQRLLAGVGLATEPPAHPLRLYRDGR